MTRKKDGSGWLCKRLQLAAGAGFLAETKLSIKSELPLDGSDLLRVGVCYRNLVRRGELSNVAKRDTTGVCSKWPRMHLLNF